MDATVKENVTRGSTWLRALFMVLFAIIYSVTEVVFVAVVVFQFGFVLISGKPNQRLLSFGQSLSTFLYEILVYFTYNTEEKPFPFGAWPLGAGEPTARQPRDTVVIDARPTGDPPSGEATDPAK